MAIYTARLWRSTSKLVTGAEETAKRQLRAYVWSEVAPTKRIDLGLLIIESAIKNTGLTPAHEVHVWTNIQTFDDPLPENFKFPASPKIITGARYVVNPGSIHKLKSTPDNMSQADIMSVYTGGKKLYFFGEIHYLDVFEEDRTSYFSLYWVGDGSWAYCDEGNKAT